MIGRWLPAIFTGIGTLALLGLMRPEIEDIRQLQGRESILWVQRYQDFLVMSVSNTDGTTLSMRRGNTFGSAVMISKDGYALTALHMISPGRTLYLEDDYGHRTVAGLVDYNEQFDIALVKMQHPLNVQPAKVAEGIYPGMTVTVIGNHMRLRSIMSRGIISGTVPQGYLVTDAVVNPGASGGGVFNRYGYLVSIINAIITPTKNMAYAGHSICAPNEAMLQLLEKYGLFNR